MAEYVQSTFGANLPVADTAAPGRQFISNVAFQYWAGKKLWPEFEVNSTSFLAGKDARQSQAKATPVGMICAAAFEGSSTLDYPPTRRITQR